MTPSWSVKCRPDCTPSEPGKNLKGSCECGTPGGCATGRLFTEIQNQMHAIFAASTLADLLAREIATPVMQFDI